MERHERGVAFFEKILPGMLGTLEGALGETAPDMLGFLIDFGAGDILSRPGLSPRNREIATVAALAALGYAEPQLRVHCHGALNAGVTPKEMVDILYVTTVFAGFPAGLNALAAMREVLTERDISLPVTPAPATGNRRQRGLKTLEETSGEAGREVMENLRQLAPDMADFILDFSCGDIFARPTLSAEEREIVMIAAAAARGTMAPQLAVHIQAALNVGMSREAITEILIQMCLYAGFPAALNGLSVARKVFEESDR